MLSNKIWGKTINISSAGLVNPYAFYVIEFCALYFVIWLMKVILKCKESNPFARIFVCIGNYSLDIMILHVTFFRLAYVLYLKAETNLSLSYEQFVDHYSGLCLLIGLAGPVLIRKGMQFAVHLLSARVSLRPTS